VKVGGGTNVAVGTATMGVAVAATAIGVGEFDAAIWVNCATAVSPAEAVALASSNITSCVAFSSTLAVGVLWFPHAARRTLNAKTRRTLIL